MKYPKINSVFKRDEKNNYRFILGEWSLPEFDFLQNCQWFGTEKIDGTNIRIYWDHKEKKVRFGGRTDNASIPTFLLDKLQGVFPVYMLENVFPEADVTLYGEGYGAKIQKVGKRYIPNGVDFILFDAMIDGWWLKRDSLIDISSKLGIGIVDCVFVGTLNEAIEKMKQDPMSSKIGEATMEGLILQPDLTLLDRSGKRIITKLKYKDFEHLK